MPYTSVSEVPDNVPEDKKKVFLEVFNTVYAESGSEKKAFAAAYAAIKKDGENMEKAGRRHSQSDMNMIDEMIAQMQTMAEKMKELRGEDIENHEGVMEKRDISAKERKKLKDSDFLYPDEKSFPVMNAEDVSAAVHSFGRSKGKSFEDFKRKLIALCRRKGLMEALPESWKKELEKAINLGRTLSEVQAAFNKKYSPVPSEGYTEWAAPSSPKYDLFASEVWDDHVVACYVDMDSPRPCYYQVVYSKTGSEYSFAHPDQWVEVEQTWKPVETLNYVVKIGKTGEKQLVYGVVMKPAPFVDTQGDVISKEEIEEAAHRFMEESRLYDLFHKEDLDSRAAVPVESYVTPQDVQWGDKVIPAGSWVVVTHIKDMSVWEKVKKGEINAYSIRGMGYRKKLPES